MCCIHVHQTIMNTPSGLSKRYTTPTWVAFSPTIVFTKLNTSVQTVQVVEPAIKKDTQYYIITGLPYIHFFSSSKFLSQKYWRKIISHRANWTKIILQVWWALIEEITPRAEEMADEKEMACCVRGYHVYKDIWAATIGEVLVLAGSQPTLFDKISL